MALDWSVVAAAVGGAAIGLIGQWIGEFNARRRDLRAYARARGDWEMQQTEAAKQEEKRLRTARQDEAAMYLLQRMQENSVGPLAAPSDDDHKRNSNLLVSFKYQAPFFLSAEVRSRLVDAADILDALNRFPPDGFTAPILNWAVRCTVWDTIDAVIRGDDLPELSKGWTFLCGKVSERREARNRQLHHQGVTADDFEFRAGASEDPTPT